MSKHSVNTFPGEPDAPPEVPSTPDSVEAAQGGGAPVTGNVPVSAGNDDFFTQGAYMPVPIIAGSPLDPGWEGVGDQLRDRLNQAKLQCQFIPAPAKPLPGDIVLIEFGSLDYTWTGYVAAVNGNWYDLVFAHPIGGRETVMQLRSTNAGVHDMERGLSWSDGWKVKGFYRK